MLVAWRPFAPEYAFGKFNIGNALPILTALANFAGCPAVALPVALPGEILPASGNQITTFEFAISATPAGTGTPLDFVATLGEQAHGVLVGDSDCLRIRHRQGKER